MKTNLLMLSCVVILFSQDLFSQSFRKKTTVPPSSSNNVVDPQHELRLDLRFKDGSTIKTEIKASNNTHLMTSDGTFDFGKIQIASFGENKSGLALLYQKLKDAGVEVNFDSTITVQGLSPSNEIEFRDNEDTFSDETSILYAVNSNFICCGLGYLFDELVYKILLSENDVN